MNYYKLYTLTMLFMAVVGFLCFAALFKVKAGYGKFRNDLWGVSFNNKFAWVLMEIPSFLCMTLMMFHSVKEYSLVRFVIASFFLTHYFHRTFIFPFLIKGKSVMPVLIVIMGIIFNTINSLLIGSWLFIFSPEYMYTFDWLFSIQFIFGSIIFVIGFIINIHSDYYIRSLRKPGDKSYYFPNKGFYKFVTSANYFGELVEWLGFAILSWSLPALLFVYWTAANLVPRACAIHNDYKNRFPQEFAKTNPKRIFPFIF